MKIKISHLMIIGLAMTPLTLFAQGYGPSPAEVQQYVNTQNQQLAQRKAEYAQQQAKYNEQKKKIAEQQAQLQKLYATPKSEIMQKELSEQGESETASQAESTKEPQTSTQPKTIPFCDNCDDPSNQYNYPANFQYNQQHKKVMRLFPEKCMCKPKAAPSVTTIQNDNSQQQEKKSSFWGIHY